MKRTTCILMLQFILPAWVGCSQTSMNFQIRGKTQQLHLYGPINGDPVILSSGDLGWAGLVEHVAEFLSSMAIVSSASTPENTWPVSRQRIAR
jgi:hypothetical protein